MPSVPKSNLSIEICRILGLDPHKTKTITIRLAAQQIAYVDVTQFVPREKGKEITEVLSHFTLTRIEEEFAINSASAALPAEASLGTQVKAVLDTLSSCHLSNDLPVKFSEMPYLCGQRAMLTLSLKQVRDGIETLQTMGHAISVAPTEHLDFQIDYQP